MKESPTPENVRNKNRQREFEHTGLRQRGPPDVVEGIAVRTADLERVRHEETQPRSTNSMVDVASPRHRVARESALASRRPGTYLSSSRRRGPSPEPPEARRRTRWIPPSPSIGKEFIRAAPRQNSVTAARASRGASGGLTSKSRADRERRTKRRYECFSRDTTTVTHARRTLPSATATLVDVDAPSNH